MTGPGFPRDDQLATGGTAVVRFNRDGVGGTLTIGGSTTTLGVGIDPL